MNNRIPSPAKPDGDVARWVQQAKNTACWLMLSITGIMVGVCIVFTDGISIAWSIVGAILTILSVVSIIRAVNYGRGCVSDYLYDDD